MEERPESNHELDKRDLFDSLNPYFLLFFSVSCILSSAFLQELFTLAGQFRVGISLAPFMGIIGPIFLIARRFGGGFRKQVRLLPLRGRLTFHTILAALAMVIVVDYLYMLTQMVMPLPTDYIEGLKELRPSSWQSAVTTFVGLCIVVPVAEEVVFRGVIQQVFHRHMTSSLAVVLAGLFFAVIHVNPQLLASMTCFGIFLGAVFFFTSSISYTILAHAVLNTVAFLQLTFSTDEALETTPFYLQQWWIVVVAVLVVITVLRQMKKGAVVDAP